VITPAHIRFSENQTQKFGDRDDPLTSEDANILVSDRLREIAGCDNSYEWFSLKGPNQIKAGCWVGVLQLGDKVIEVRPKIEGNDSQIDLNAMLAIALGIKGASRFTSYSSPGHFIDFFAYDYAKRISALVQHGLPHRYIEQQSLLSTLKGRLDLPRQIMADATGVPKIACIHDTFSADNPLSQYLKAGLQAANRFTQNAATKRAIKSALAELDFVSDRVVDPEELNHFSLSHQEQQLTPLCNLAKLLLRGHSFETHFSDQNKVKKSGFSLMFNMWEIFEAYAVQEINLVLKDTPWIANAHDKRLNGKSWYLGNNNFIELKPDIIIRERAGNRSIVCIADTKWKKDAGYTRATPADAYQVLAYAATLTAEEGIAHEETIPVALIYPQIGKRASEVKPKWDKKANDPLAFLRKPAEQPSRLNAYKKLTGLHGTISQLYLNCPDYTVTPAARI